MRGIPLALVLAVCGAAGFLAGRLVLDPGYQPVPPPAAYRPPPAAGSAVQDPAPARPHEPELADEARAYLESPPDDPGGIVAVGLASRLARVDLAAALNWASGLPEGSETRRGAIHNLVHHAGQLLKGSGMDAFWGLVASAPEELRAALIADGLAAADDELLVADWLASPPGQTAADQIAAAIASVTLDDPGRSADVRRALDSPFTRLHLLRLVAYSDNTRGTAADWVWLNRQDDPLAMLGVARDVVGDWDGGHAPRVGEMIAGLDDPRRRRFLLEELVSEIPDEAAEVLAFDRQIEHGIAPWLAAQPERARQEFARVFLDLHGDHLGEDAKTVLAVAVEQPGAAARALEALGTGRAPRLLAPPGTAARITRFQPTAPPPSRGGAR